MSLNCIIYLFLVFFFFFKQKTAYEMRISDWSSDVCSSDLPGSVEYLVRRRHRAQPHHAGLDPRNRRGHDPHQRRRSRFLTGSARADDQRRRAVIDPRRIAGGHDRSEEHTSELQSLMRISYAVFCLKKQNLRKYLLMSPQTPT